MDYFLLNEIEAKDLTGFKDFVEEDGITATGEHLDDALSEMSRIRIVLKNSKTQIQA